MAWSDGVATKAPFRRRGGIPQAPPLPYVVADPGDLPARGRDGQHQRVGIDEPEGCCHLVLVLQEELVVLALSQAVQLDPDVGEERRRAVEGIEVRVVGQQRGEGRDGAQHADVAQPAVALLQVGLKEERHVTGCGTALGHLLLEQREVPGTQPVAPCGAGLLEERLRDLGLAPHEPAVEQAERHPDVLGGRAEDLGGTPDRVVEVDPLVPDRVPDGVGDLPDVPVAVVDEHHIEVAVRAERAPPVAPHGHESEVPFDVTGGPFGQAGEPGVRLGGIAATKFLSPQPRLGQQPAAPITE